MTREEQQILLLRTEAEFISDASRRSLEWWWDRTAAAVMILPEFLEHAREYHWAERRMAFWKGVQAAWLRQKHVQLIQTRVGELAEAQELKGKVFQFIRPRVDEKGIERFPIAPRSWEGMIKAYAILDDLVESKRAVILTALEPLLAASEQEIAGDPSTRELPFNRDEMRELAHNLLRERRRRRRDDLGIEDDDDESDDTEADGAGPADDPERVARSG